MRRATVSLMYEGKDISGDIGPDLLSFTFTDKSGARGEADDLQVIISDRNRVWQDAWCPQRGHAMQAGILCTDWFEPGDCLELPCGTFQVDEVEFEAGETDRITIKGVPSAVKTSITGQKKTRAWNSTSLQQIAADIAAEAGLTLLYRGEAVPLQRVEQRQEPDLAFLHRVGGEYGCRVKVYADKLVVYSGTEADGLDAIVLTRSVTSNFRGKIVTAEVYSSCVVTFTDPASGKDFRYTYTPDDAPKTGKVLTVNRRVESVEAAQRMARAALRGKNAGQMSGEWEGMGDPRLRAGGALTLQGYGRWDARYSIKEATHTVSGDGGYTTSISLESALGY